MMVLFTLSLAGIFEILLPILLGVWLTARFHTSWKLVGVGALTFLLSQAGHLPTLNILTGLFQTGVLPTPPAGWLLPFNAVLLGSLAGLFEETARVVGFALLKRSRSWADALTLAAGHGGVESALIGFSALGNLVLALVASQGHSFPGISSPVLQSIAVQLQATPWSLPLAAALERVGAIALHLCLSVLVLQAFVRRNALYYLAAVLWHTLADGVPVYLSGMGGSVWGIEGVGLAFGAVSILILLRFRDSSRVAPATFQAGQNEIPS